MIQAWVFDSFLTFMPYAVTFISTCAVSKYVVKKKKLHTAENLIEGIVIATASTKALAFSLLVALLASFLAQSNRPKNDITPNQYNQQSAYKSEIDSKATGDIKEIKPIQSEFNERKEKTKKLFEY